MKLNCGVWSCTPERQPLPPPKRRATAENLAIGQKLRALRLDRGLSQGDLTGETKYALVTLAKVLARGGQP